MIRLVVLFLIIGIGLPLCGQSGRIYGVVKDSINSKPLEYTTVMLYKSNDNEAITGTITNTTGAFNIGNIQSGNYYLLFSFVGYRTKRIDGIKLDGSNESINLNIVRIQSTQANLQELAIDGTAPAIDYRIDKKVITVNKQLASQAGTAVDILENVSSVQVDMNGNVRLRGSSGITVLIDGKPSILTPSEALRQVPAKTIESIEIITNPSAKFDSEGSAGIINIISKKDKLEGTSAYINLNVGSFGKYGGDFLVSYKKNKVNIYLGADYNKRGYPGSRSRERTTFDEDTVFYTTSIGSYTRDRTNGGVRAGIDYSITEHDFMSVDLKYQNWKTDRTSEDNVDEWSVPDGMHILSTNLEDRNTGGDIFTIKSHYIRMFSKIGHQLKASFSYDYQIGKDNSVNELITPEGSISDGKKNFESGTADLFRFKIDYTLPIGKQSELEAGLQSRIQLYNDNTSLDDYDVEEEKYFDDPDFAQVTDYTRNIQSFYGLFRSEVKSFGYQFGFRGEYTDRVIENSSNPDPFTFKRFNFFPTFHLSYDFPKQQQIFASYGRRIDRPNSSWLEPFFTWTNAFNIRRGNPELVPEYVDSYEIGYLKKFDKNAFSVESYYRVSYNEIEEISRVYKENIMLHTYENVGEDYSLGLEFTFSYHLFKWWDLDLLGNFFNYRVEGELNDVDFSNQTNSWSSRFNNTFKIYKQTQIQINSLYNGPTVNAQGRAEGYYRLNAAIKTAFLENSLSVVLEFRDVFSSVRYEYNGEGPRFQTNTISQRDAPLITFSVSYRFDND